MTGIDSTQALIGTYAKITELVRMLSAGGERDDILRGLVTHLREWSGCDAVGIRLRDGQDFPYFETRGFSEEFVRLENSLCTRDCSGEPVVDESGQPKLECMCGNVIQGRYDTQFPFFTGRGSFWSNCTTVLLAGTSPADRQADTRNRCNGVGYESVALVPLRFGQTTYGLLQFNDKRENRFTPELIAFLECLADNIAMALSRLEEQAALRKAEEKVRSVARFPEENPFPILRAARDGTLLYANATAVELMAQWRCHTGGKAPEFMRREVSATLESGAIREVETRLGERFLSFTLAPLADEGYVNLYGHDVTESKRLEESLKRKNAISAGINQIFHKALTCQTEEELGMACLAVAEEVTGSRFGFLGEIGPDGLLHDIAISDPGWEACQMHISGKLEKRIPPASFHLHGVYGRVLLDGAPLIANDPSSHPDSVGIPPGHPPLTAFLGVPLLQAGRVIGMIGLGNKPGGYNQEDVESAEAVAVAATEALYRKRTERALQESEARYRLLFESMDQGFCIIEVLFDDSGKAVDYQFLEVNPVFEKQTGIKNAVGRRMREIAPQHEEHWFQIYGDIALTGKSLRFENAAEALGRYYEVYAFRVGDPEKRQVAIFFDDISPRKRAEQALAESEKRFRTLANAIPQLAWMANADGFITWYNDRWYEYTGTTPKQMEGWGWQSVHDPEVLPQVLEHWQASIATGKPFDMVFPLLGADGVFRPFLTRIMPLKDTQGRVVQWFGTNTDISDQKKMEAEIKAAKDVAESLAGALEIKVKERTSELERKNKDLQDFAHITSHDLQEPLRKIQTFGERLRTEYAQALGDQGRDFLARMEKSASRMQAFIYDLLEYSRVTSRPNPFVRADLAKIARLATADLDARVEETGGLIEIGELPKAEVDPGQMRQVFLNLIANALKYHGQEPPLIRVSGETVSKDGRKMARILVSDNGIGFDEQFLDKIFTPFQRLHSKSAYEGTGIGLALVRKIVERHGGTVTATSAPGRGATFIMDIPLKQPRAQAEETGPGPG